ncbi:MAG: Na+/H+ antiporter subunit C [Pseudomonadota bacterium]
MEILVASAVGILTAAGIYLILRKRTFPVILGTAFISYAVNVFLFASGRLAVNEPPVLQDDVVLYSDPLPQALVLTAIVIAFGMTAVVVMIGVGAYLSSQDDHIDDVDEVQSDGTGANPSADEPTDPSQKGAAT